MMVKPLTPLNAKPFPQLINDVLKFVRVMPTCKLFTIIIIVCGFHQVQFLKYFYTYKALLCDMINKYFR